MKMQRVRRSVVIDVVEAVVVGRRRRSEEAVIEADDVADADADSEDDDLSDILLKKTGRHRQRLSRQPEGSAKVSSRTSRVVAEEGDEDKDEEPKSESVVDLIAGAAGAVVAVVEPAMKSVHHGDLAVATMWTKTAT